MIWQFVDSSSVGGIESHVATLTGELVKAGFPAKIVLLQAHGDNPWLKQLETRGLKVQVLEGGWGGLRRALSENRPQLLHTHGYKAGILGRLAARLVSIPVVSTFHAGERGPFPVSLYQSLDAWSSWLGSRIAVNETIAGQIPFKTQVVPNFISMPEREPRSPLPRAVGFVGRLSQEKGPDLFCEIASRLRGESSFHVFGDGPMRVELEARYGSFVTFHGLQTNMSQIWPTIGLLLMPSRAEGLPMAALEALANGIPVAASAVGALPGVIDIANTGWLFPAGNVNAAVQAVSQWADMEAGSFEAMSRECHRQAGQKFGPARPLARILEIYRQAGLK